MRSRLTVAIAVQVKTKPILERIPTTPLTKEEAMKLTQEVIASIDWSYKNTYIARQLGVNPSMIWRKFEA